MRELRQVPEVRAVSAPEQELIAFLAARLDEDERVARAAVDFDYGVRDWADDGDPVNAHIARHDPTRVLREVEAKRRILEQYEASLEQSKRFRQRAASGVESDAQKLQRSTESIRLLVLLGVVRLLALPYADHPDYREDLRP